MTATFEDLITDQKVTAKFIQNFLVNTSKVKKTSITVGYLNHRVDLLNGYWDSYRKNHHALARFPEFEESEYCTEDMYSTVELLYSEHTAVLKHEIEKLQPQSNTASSSAQPTTQSNTEPVVRQIHLPQIDLPMFGGNPLEWESFRDLFDSMVIKVPGLSNVQKLIYLRSRLTGEAKLLVSNTPVTENAFDGAWEDLKFRNRKPKAKTPNPPVSSCTLCSGEHRIASCPQFIEMQPISRRYQIQNFKLCQNCLRPGHLVPDCHSTHRCRTCNRDHHSLLHIDSSDQTQSQSTRQNETHNQPRSQFPQHTKSVSCCTLSSVTNRAVLLATARIQICDQNGHSIVIRALLDPGAESTFISECATQKLNLKREIVNVKIQGVQACSTGTSTHEVAFTINSLKDNNFSINIHALVLPKLTGLIPSAPITPKSWDHVSGLSLADPDFSTPGEVDLIIGADLCGHLFLGDKRVGSLDEPVACRTPFGWVLMGPVDFENTNVRRSHL